MTSQFAERLRHAGPIILDGATGTELANRGAKLSPPAWSAGVILEQPELLAQIHRDYLDAGAEVITANTFRTHSRNLRQVQPAVSGESMTHSAVEIARSVVQDRAFVAGSIAPLEDCYTPAATPSLGELEAEHRQMARWLADAGVDVILIETQITVREAAIAASAAAWTGLPFCVSFTCNSSGNLLSGESLIDAAQAVLPSQPLALLVNCIPAEEVLNTLEALRRQFPRLPLGAYANTGRLLPNGVWEQTGGAEPAFYAELAESWKAAELRMIGGCCGTGPAHISALREIL